MTEFTDSISFGSALHKESFRDAKDILIYTWLQPGVGGRRLRETL
jgi:hypothetical protein